LLPYNCVELYQRVTKIETGAIKKPSVFVMAKIAKALGADIWELIRQICKI